MSLKKSVKKFIKSQGNDSVLGKAYLSAVGKKRQKRYEKYADLPVDDKLIVFEAFMGRKYTDSPRAIYEKLLADEKYADYHFIWCFRDSVMDGFLHIADEPRTELVRWGSEEYYETYAKAAYWITNTRIPGAIDIRPEQVYVQCWHGTPLKRLGCDIETEATESKETTKKVIHGDARRYSYFISPSPFYTRVMTSAFDLKALGKENVMIETGYPRNDALADADTQKQRQIRDALGIPADKKVILYAPTYRENEKDQDSKYTFRSALDYDRLRDRLGEEYVVLFRAHYFIAKEFDFDKYGGFIIDVSDYAEINDLYIASDMLITDYSSVFFDYSVLKRPVIFYMYDLAVYRDELRGFYLTLDDLHGPITTEQEELEETIITCETWSSEPEYLKKYEAFRERFAPYEDGHATDRVIETVMNGEIEQ